MIAAPKNLFGTNVFKIFVHELGGAVRVSKMLDVTERTVRRWLAEDCVPKMAVLALYWETQYGRSLIDTDHQAEVALLRGHIRILESQFQRATQVIQGIRALDYGTANEPLFDALGEFNFQGITQSQSTGVEDGSVQSAQESMASSSHPKLSPREQARKAAMLKRREETAHLSPEEYAKRVLQRVRNRETRAKRELAA